MDMADVIKSLASQQIEGGYPTNILFGTIKKINPITLVIDKREYTADFIVVADHLSKKSFSASIKCNNTMGTISNETISVSGGSHSHNEGTHGGHTDGSSGSHSHNGGEHSHNVSEHTHSISNLSSGKVELTIDNSLKNGDKVIVLRQQGGQKFVILDRIGG